MIWILFEVPPDPPKKPPPRHDDWWASVIGETLGWLLMGAGAVFVYRLFT